MMYTAKHYKAINQLAIVALLLFVYQLAAIWWEAGNVPDFATITRFQRFWLYGLGSLVSHISFWLAIGFVTGEKRGALISLAWILTFYLAFQFVPISNAFFASKSYHFVKIGISLIAYGMFGFLYFKKREGLWLCSVYILSAGFISHLMYKPFYNIIGELIGGRNDSIFSLHIPISESGYRVIDVLSILFNELTLVTQLILFLFVFTSLKSKSKFNWRMLSIQLPENMSKLTYSIIFWSLRFPLFVVATGGLGRLTEMKEASLLYQLLNLLMFVVSVYFLASLYRNFVTAYLFSKGRKPSWQYWILHIPIVHVFGWIYTLFLKDVDVKDSVELERTTKERWDKMITDFSFSDKNPFIKTVVIILVILSAINRCGKSGVSISDLTDEGMIVLGYSFINLLAVFWFISDYRAMTVLYGLQVLAGVVFLFMNPDFYGSMLFAAGLINVLIYFPLFHLDQLTLDSEDIFSDSDGIFEHN